MEKYPKIQSIFKRDEKTHKFIEGEFSCPEFEYLKDNIWMFSEKIDGTNIRVNWDLSEVRFGGRTDNAQVPTFLLDKLQDLFPIDIFKSTYSETPMCLYGEGYGARIQKGGGNYIPDGVSFILFDVLIDEWWLKREDIKDIARNLGILVVPFVGSGTIADAVFTIKNEWSSTFGDFLAEGLVLKPAIELKMRSGERIITKLKHRDF